MGDGDRDRNRQWADLERPARPSRALQLWRKLSWDAAVVLGAGGLLFGLASAVGY